MFEIHITTNTLKETEIEQFVKFCSSIEAKPILIELPEGNTMQQPMISKVYTDISEGGLKSKIDLLESKFKEQSYDVVRTKVEVPLDYINRGRREFPNYKGQYYEWHGKVEFEDFNKLQQIIGRFRFAHLSKNALKDESNRRFVTVRTYNNKRLFLSNVESVKKTLSQNKLHLIKDEFEYCIYDSNKSTDSGWMDIPEITDENYLNLLAFEGYLRRMADKEEVFLLKGSLLTRQYLDDINTRDALDLDFIYGEFIDNDEDARTIFTNWVTDVTETYENDNIIYQSFKKNEFWRRIDYAMNDDFPTTNTDLSCKIKDYEIPVIGLDISWNLPLKEKPIPLLYKPQFGESFTIPYTVPLPTQIAWKLHQTIVRPRAKDLIDVILLLKSNKLSDGQLDTLSDVFIAECNKDEIDPLRLKHYSSGEVFSFLDRNRSKLDEAHDRYWSVKTPFGFKISTAMKLPFLDDLFKIDFTFKDVQGLTKTFEMALRRSNIVDRIEGSEQLKSAYMKKHKASVKIIENVKMQIEKKVTLISKLRKFFSN